LRGKKLLPAFLLGVGLCFIPVLGYGYISELDYERRASKMEVNLLKAGIDYMMANPTGFLNVSFHYDPGAGLEQFFPEGVVTKGRIVILVTDNRDAFSDKSGIALLEQFKEELEAIYKCVRLVASDMDADIVAEFLTSEDVPLGYFYQGEYHLWEK